MQEQMTTIFQGIMLETCGSFAFWDGAIESAATVPGLSAEMLLMECMRRIDEQRQDERTGSGERLLRILTKFNGAFRDIFATAGQAGDGVGEALAGAAAFTFAGETGHAGCYRGIEFDADGELPPDHFLAQFEAALEPEDDPEQLLLEVLSKAILFLLFVAGEHLDPQVHETLHARVKATVASAVE